MIASGSSRTDVEVLHIAAYCEGSVGWMVDRVTVTTPDCAELPVRHTCVFHQEDGTWKMVQPHVSIAVPDEQIR